MRVEVEVDGEVWHVRWKHSPHATKTVKHYGREWTQQLPRTTFCAVYRQDEEVAIGEVTTKMGNAKPWQPSKKDGDQFSRAAGRKESLRRAMEASNGDERVVPRAVRKALWDKYHDFWPYDPADALVMDIANIAMQEIAEMVKGARAA